MPVATSRRYRAERRYANEFGPSVHAPPSGLTDVTGNGVFYRTHANNRRTAKTGAATPSRPAGPASDRPRVVPHRYRFAFLAASMTMRLMYGGGWRVSLASRPRNRYFRRLLRPQSTGGVSSPW